MSYSILLFDADETILDFKKSERSALENTFSKHKILPSDELCKKFSETNQKLWKLFEKKEIEKPDIIKRRFKETLEFFNMPYSPQMGFEGDYQEFLSAEHSLIPHAREVCEELCKTHSMYIITNGLLATQTRRLGECGILPCFKNFFVSEQIGFQKPSVQYFNKVLELIGNPNKREILIIGDSCSSDINGGIAAGIDTCWYNPQNAPLTAVSSPSYTISDLRELLSILK